jgi:hypothetical protein
LINVNDHGNYWSTTRKNSNYAEYLAFTHSTNKLYVDAQLEINVGRSVRLVHDTIVSPPAPCMMVKVNDTLSINMMCVEGGTFMMGAKEDDPIVMQNLDASEIEANAKLGGLDLVKDENYKNDDGTTTIKLIFQKP